MNKKILRTTALGFLISFMLLLLCGCGATSKQGSKDKFDYDEHNIYLYLSHYNQAYITAEIEYKTENGKIASMEKKIRCDIEENAEFFLTISDFSEKIAQEEKEAIFTKVSVELVNTKKKINNICKLIIIYLILFCFVAFKFY